MTTSTTDLHGIVAEHVAAVNAQDEHAIVATFAASSRLFEGRPRRRETTLASPSQR